MHGITAGLLAEQIGVFRCYNILISITAIALVIAPQTASYMPHDGASSSGKSGIMLVRVCGCVCACEREKGHKHTRDNARMHLCMCMCMYL